MIPWIREEPKDVFGYAFAIAQAFTALVLIWVFYTVLKKVGILSPMQVAGMSTFLTDNFYSIIIAPISEEVMYRAVPLWLAVHLSRNEEFVPTVVVVSSLVFGIHHDGGFRSIALQGTGGLVICALYLKCGGLRGAFLAPLTCAIILHMSWNSSVILLATLFR